MVGSTTGISVNAVPLRGTILSGFASLVMSAVFCSQELMPLPEGGEEESDSILVKREKFNNGTGRENQFIGI